MSAPVGLLPCPLCGKTDPVRITRSSDQIEFDCSNDDYFAVICDASKDCGVGPGGCGAASGYEPTQDEAISAWNRRAAPVPPVAPSAPLAWYTIRSKNGKQTLEFGSCMPTNPAYIEAHKEWDWIPLYAAPAPSDLTDAQKAAPELLAALQVLVDNGGIGPESMFHDARDAIAKATGSQA